MHVRVHVQENEQLLDVQAAVAASEAAVASLQTTVVRLERERGAVEELLAGVRGQLMARESDHAALLSRFNQVSHTLRAFKAARGPVLGADGQGWVVGHAALLSCFNQVCEL